jgi:hypothetical protein
MLPSGDWRRPNSDWIIGSVVLHNNQQTGGTGVGHSLQEQRIFDALHIISDCLHIRSNRRIFTKIHRLVTNVHYVIPDRN